MLVASLGFMCGGITIVCLYLILIHNTLCSIERKLNKLNDIEKKNDVSGELDNE